MKNSVDHFVLSSVWGKCLDPEERERVLSTSKSVRLGKSERVACAGDQAEFWVGLVDGLIVQSVTELDGRASVLTATCSGTWFGEGTLMKRERWRYDAIATRKSFAVLIPFETFDWLRQRSLPFNHFLESLLNARISCYIGMLAAERLLSVDARLARILSGLFDPILYPGRGPFIPMRQSEIGNLVGLSRQRTNEALRVLERLQLIAISRDGITVLNLSNLSQYRGDGLLPVSKTAY